MSTALSRRRIGPDARCIFRPAFTVGQDRAEQVAKKQGRRPKFVRDMREVFDDPSVDVVSTATPNHWHALCSIWAMQAGKDMYCEKPVSHNVSEGRRMVEAARKYKRICQTGTQCRSMQGSIEAIEYVQSGKIGEVKLARGLCYKRRKSIGPKGTYEVPKEVDYDLWSGPAPIEPLTRERFHYDWHWQRLYGNGDLGNQGPHQMDLARWGLGIDRLCDWVVAYGGRLGYEDAASARAEADVRPQEGDLPRRPGGQRASHARLPRALRGARVRVAPFARKQHGDPSSRLRLRSKPKKNARGRRTRQSGALVASWDLLPVTPYLPGGTASR